ncbi:MAG: membrane dipeptidase [Acidobacteriota bacterium]
MLSRRTYLQASAAVCAAPLLGGPMRLFGNDRTLFVPDVSAVAKDLVQESMVVDMLGLITLDYKKLVSWQSIPQSFHEADFKRLKDSGVTVLHPGVGFVTGDVYNSSLQDLTRWNTFLTAYPQWFTKVLEPRDLALAKASGKIGIILGLQNSQHFRSLADVDAFYKLGQRISQLTYFNNKLGGGSTDPQCGLSAFGGDVVKRMNQLGMAIDLSHCSDHTTLDAIAQSTKPVLITHSNCRALVPGNTRCKTDEAIRKLAANGGVLGVTMVRPFVRAGGPVTLEDVLKHIDHVASLVGVEHVGLGTDVDLDGREHGAPRSSDLDGVQYPRKVLSLVEGLLRRRYSSADVQRIIGGNVVRTLTASWAA